MNRHIDIKTLSDYFLNRLTPEEETAVQEHLSQCPECSEKLAAMRRLRDSMFAQEQPARPAVFKIVRSGWFKAAAAVIIVAGIGLFTAETVRHRSSVLEQHEINGGGDIENEVFAIDTFDKQDSTYYREKYGDDFKM